ncbi:hypothetical protein [Deinococcus sp. UYEF24]
MSKTATLLFLLPALLLGACGQTTPPVAVLPSPSSSHAPVVDPLSATLSLKLFIPAAAQSQALRPQFVSSATSSLRVQLGASDTTLALNDANCAASTGGQTCTFSVNVAPGLNQTLTVSTYDASLHLLSTSTSTVSIIAGQDNPLALTLTGVAASASFMATDRSADISSGLSGSLLLDLGGSYTAGIALLDAAGQTILNPGRPTETVTSSNASFTVTDNGVGVFRVLAPDPIGSDQSTTLTVKDAGGSVLLTQVLTVPAEKVVLSLATASPVAASSLLATARLTSNRGRPLPIAGRPVGFITTNGFFANSEQRNESATTDSSGMVSLSLYSSPIGGVSGVVTASNDGASGSSTFITVAGVANTTTSSALLSPGTVQVGGVSTLTVTLKDEFGNPVTTVPTVTVNGAATLGAASQSGNVFTYAVSAASVPGVTNFTVISDGNPVGVANLTVTAYPLTVSDGGAALVSGSSQYDFQNSAAHTFAVAAVGYVPVFAVAAVGYVPVFTVSSSNTAVATASVSGGALTVTPGHTAGLSTITVSDLLGRSFTFMVSVTTATLTIN